MTFIPDSEIKDNEQLFRAIHPIFWNEDENKPSSAMFKDKKGVSVDRDGKREQDSILSFLLINRDNYGAGELNAGLTREVGVYLKADRTDDNPYHALIFDSKEKIRISNSKAKALSNLIRIIKPPK